MDKNLPSQKSNHHASPDHPENDGVGVPRAHKAPDYVPTTPVDDHPTAAETARQAIETARKLSPAMRATMRLSHGRGVTPACGRVATIAALVSRGLVVGTTAYEQPVTDLGRVVHAVLVNGEAVVLADAERHDKDAKAAAHARREYDAMEAASGMANANHAIERGSSERWMGEALDNITDRTDARAVAYRVTLLDGLHGRALDEVRVWALTDHTAWENAHTTEIADVERRDSSAANLREQRDRHRTDADTPPEPAEVDTAEPVTEAVTEALPTGGLTEQSLALFLAYAKDAGNWSGTPPVDGNVAGTAEGRGNLTQMKQRGLITTFRYDGGAWVDFTPEGRTLAAAHNIVIPDQNGPGASNSRTRARPLADTDHPVERVHPQLSTYGAGPPNAGTEQAP